MTRKISSVHRLLLAAAGAATLAACGPLSPEAAARYCEDRARLAAGPRGQVYAGVAGGSGGVRPAYGAELTVTSDWIQGRDPYQLYEDCVRDRSGQGPIRPVNLG